MKKKTWKPYLIGGLTLLLILTLVVIVVKVEKYIRFKPLVDECKRVFLVDEGPCHNETCKKWREKMCVMGIELWTHNE